MSKFFKNWGKIRYSYRTILVFICFMTTMRISLETGRLLSILITLYNAFGLYISIKLDIENKELEKIEFLERFLDERDNN